MRGILAKVRLADVVETALAIRMDYQNFDDLSTGWRSCSCPNPATGPDPSPT
jgi:hypothetical protein